MNDNDLDDDADDDDKGDDGGRVQCRHLQVEERLYSESEQKYMYN